ncbi:Chromosome partitioning ATPase, Mrp family, contains Fe-S cluster [Desulfoluna spongiiphila]|uniref:Chromosome partitioning ATPase, Mrp family, contains Fe-S cluster n=2 Tax=Desulfoluna spongiiphila TaxID=419481 RepID=A0A1G5F204_9BACT|nr:Chromosome partitioning ATPase, Mrp family, contains Fe-S cluster [Desulfoluna spongiiphila]
MNRPNESHLETLGKIAETKRIFTAIQTATGRRESLCLVITSGARGEGKTTVATGLAMAASHPKRRKTLLVDYNWYAPAIHKTFDVELIENPAAFYGAASIDELIVPTHLGIDILPAARMTDDSQGALSNVEGYDHRLIQEAKHRYDTIIVDTSATFPENQNMRDPVLLSSIADGVVLVFMTNRTPRSTLKRTTTAMRINGAKIIGVVANQWKNPILY